MEEMKLGFGLYRHMLDRAHFQFARQCGATHLVIHLASYYKDQIVAATDETRNYGESRARDPIWEPESLERLRREAAEWGLTIHAVENFSPADWYDVLLDGPQREEQLARLKEIIRGVGAAGIPAFGYNFSLAGVGGHQKRPSARGGAVSSCFDASALNLDAPIPNGEVWNMTYAPGDGGTLPPIDSDTLWRRLAGFLKELLPVAEEAGVELALHPDDPPMPTLRGTPRLVYQPEYYQRLIDLDPSPSNKLEFCMGSIQEMSGGSIYDAIERYAAQGRISYVHFRNVRGKVPRYDEVFVDEGDIDMPRALSLLQKHHFTGVLIPDHTPEMTCGAPWHAGMAYAMGYMRAALQMLGRGAP